MKLPNGADAEVPRGKVGAYLLSTAHPVGSAKARYFTSRGYRSDSKDLLERDLRVIARDGVVRSSQDTEWGTKYLVTGIVVAPDGDSIELATVWMVRGAARPVLVTAYPWRGRET